MAVGSLDIWTNARLNEAANTELERGTQNHRLRHSSVAKTSNLVAGEADPAARTAEVLLGQPSPDDILASTRLRWVHLTSAGYTRYDNDAVRSALRARGAVMTNSSTVYGDPCAQHVLAMMLAQARRLPDALVDQLTRRDWNYLPLRAKSKLLTGQSALIVGYGAIARRVIELLDPFEMSITVVRHTVRGDEPVRTIATAEMPSALPHADHVVNTLPLSDSTRRLFGADMFARMRPDAVFYNVGRGDTVDQDAMQEALSDGRIAAAMLDVTVPEPLPPDHPLWKLPNCWITPHVAGGHHDELERLAHHFLANLRRFESGQPLLDRIV